MKPGKGDPTLCMSCSDKLAKWQVLGLQGSLLSIFIVEPIRLNSITIGGGSVSFNKEALQRAVFTRFSEGIAKTLDKPNLSLEGYQCPDIQQSRDNFMKLVETQNPAPASISWYPSLSVLDPNKEAIQVLVGGRKQGATKKFFGKPSSMVDICRAEIFTRFKSLYFSKDGMLKTYKDCKAMSKTYNETWIKLKKNVFVGWTEKPEEFQQFT